MSMIATTVLVTKFSSGKLIPHIAGRPMSTVDGHASTLGVSKLFSEMKSYKINATNMSCS